MNYFLDFEASSLVPSNFSIEVVWVDQDAQDEDTLIRSAPVRTIPDAGVLEWSVSTQSGHAYRLETPDTAERDPVLRGHLAYGLRAWRFDDVQE